MKRIIILLPLFFSLLMTHGQVKIDRVEPANWYCGMNDPSLQILLHGKGIREADVTTDYPGVTIDSLVRLESPNYLLVYLNLKDAKPGEMKLRLSKSKTVITYPLLARDMAGAERKGFSNEDVLYMLMPDRFAQGRPSPNPSLYGGKKSKKLNNQTTKQLNNQTTKQLNNQTTINRAEPSLRHGGNLEGIRQHLPYLKDLGVTALWFTPVLENDSPDNGTTSTYHGYATTNYYRVDPRFGTNEEYRQLIREAHELGLKVVMDMIFNHCGYDHPWISDLPSKDWLNTPDWLFAPKTGKAETAEGQSTTYSGGTNDLYVQTNYKLTPVVDPYASEADLRETVDGWFVPSMPDLNQRNPHVMKYLIQNSEWWIEYAGIDGIRMDTYPYADARGMAGWMKTLNDEYPNFNVVGESWVTEPGFTAALQAGSGFNQNVLTAEGKVEKAFPCQLTSPNSCISSPRGGQEGAFSPRGGQEGASSHLNTVMDFTFFDRLNSAKNEETDAWWNGLNKIYNTFVYDFLYPNPKSVLAFLDNHDTDRFLGDGKDSLMLKQGLALLLTINRIPQIYYGTEIMMNGTKAITDGNVRKDFPGGFPGDERNAFTPEGRTKAENAMFNWLRKLLHWRQGNKVITEGKQVHFTPQNGVYVMGHTLGNKHVLVILNGTSKPAEFNWQRYAELIPANTTATEVTSGRKYSLNRNIKLGKRQTLILEY